MFKRLQYDEMQAVITIIAFFIFFLTFLYFCYRAWRMKNSERRHMSNLPLESEDPRPDNDHDEQR